MTSQPKRPRDPNQHAIFDNVIAQILEATEWSGGDRAPREQLPASKQACARVVLEQLCVADVAPQGIH